MKIALVAPKWNKLVNSYPPLGLAYLAAVLERAGHTVGVFDFGLTPHTELADDVGRVAAFAPDLIGMTAMTNTWYSAVALAGALKSVVACPIVVGGPHATVFPERVAQEPAVSYVVVGEGEETFLELVGLLERSGMAPRPEALGAVRGLCFMHGGALVKTAERPLIADLDALPFPARHLFDLWAYPLYTPDGQRMLTVLSSRGCPYNCSYCFKGIVGRTYRQRSPANIIAELQSLIDTYGVRNFYFIDDLFTLDAKRLRAFAEQVIAARLDIRWQCLARVDRVTPDLLRLMHQAGCRQVHYGIESADQAILDRIGKGITPAMVRRAVDATRAAGIRSKGYFMLGLPGDTEATIRETIAFAADLDLDDAMFSLTTPFPGTRLWDELVARHPETAYDQDFSRAYYYSNYSEEIAPFMNVSGIPDHRLSQLAQTARRRVAEGKRLRKYQRVFGHLLGRLLWGISRFKPLRLLGRAVLRLTRWGGSGRLSSEEQPTWTL